VRVVLVAGGTGGAKLAVGLQRALAPGRLTVIANVGDDCTFWGLHVSPDIDAVLFRLAGIFNEETGFGVAGDTFATRAMMERLGVPAWFALGDRDLAFHVLRTEMLAAGARLTETALELGRRLGVPTPVLPVSDDPIRTRFETDQGSLPFQEFYVLHGARPAPRAVVHTGLEAARPAPEVLAALAAADRVVIGPSNPVVSVWPVLKVIAPALDRARTIAVSPTVGGRALKGPTVEMMRALGRDPSALGVAREYAELAGGYVLDQEDAAARAGVEALGYQVLVTDTLMTGADAAERLARELLAAP
jgi:LPPG:FO 2-phospho-L-lactate transferase